MAYISDLADELNRQEWAVERMLKNRGYLKQNGDPRKSTIDNGLMREDGFIYKKGWDLFVDELGYRESDDSDDDEDIFEKIKEELDTSIREELSDVLYNFYQEDAEFDFDYLEQIIETVNNLYAEGHTVKFLKIFVEKGAVVEELDDVYAALDTSDLSDEHDSILESLGLNDDSISLIREKWYEDFEAINYQWFYQNCKIYDEAYQTALEHYDNDREKAILIADSSWYSEKVPVINDKLEEFLEQAEQWKCTLCIRFDENDFEYEETYTADYILKRFYEYDNLEVKYNGDEVSFYNGPSAHVTFEPL